MALKIGHIRLASGPDDAIEHFIRLVETLAERAIAQHVLVADEQLARRLAVCSEVSLGPIVRAPVMAYCLMPEVSIVHAHDAAAAQAGLLLTLTRSMPYVISRRSKRLLSRNPVARAAVSRAASVICPTAAAAAALQADGLPVPVDVVEDIRAANGHKDADIRRITQEHLRIYQRAVGSPGVPAMLL